MVDCHSSKTLKGYLTQSSFFGHFYNSNMQKQIAWKSSYIYKIGKSITCPLEIYPWKAENLSSCTTFPYIFATYLQEASR